MFWYVIAVRSSLHSRIIDKLDAINVRWYSPTRIVLRKMRKGPRQPREYPLIPGYLFVQVDMWVTSARSISSIDGVIGFLGVEGVPEVIEAGEIDRMRDDEARGDHDETLRRIEQLLVGHSVTITQGPFEGHTATIKSLHDDIATVSVTLFKRDQAIKINVDKLSKPH